MSNQQSVLKRFLVFAYDAYYPSGGWNDYQGSFETLAEVRKHIAEVNEETSAPDYFNVVDAHTGKAVKELATYNEAENAHMQATENRLMALPHAEATALLARWQALVDEAEQGQAFLFKP